MNEQFDYERKNDQIVYVCVIRLVGMLSVAFQVTKRKIYLFCWCFFQIFE